MTRAAPRADSALSNTTAQPSSPPQRTAVAIAGLTLVVIGGSMFNILPLIAAGAADKLGFSASQAGML